MVGIPAAVTHRMAAIEVEARYAVDAVGEAFCFKTVDSRDQFGGEHFVCVDGEHVAMCGERGDKLTLCAESGKCPLGDTASVSPAYLYGGVGGVGVDYYNLVGNLLHRL